MAPSWAVFYLDPLGYIPLVPANTPWLSRKNPPSGNILANSMMQWRLTWERFYSNNLPEIAKLYSNKCFHNSLKCTNIAAAGASSQKTLGELTAIQIPMMYICGWEREKWVRNLWVHLSSWWAAWLCLRPYTKHCIIFNQIDWTIATYKLCCASFSHAPAFYAHYCRVMYVKLYNSCVLKSGMLGLEAWPRPRGQKTWPRPRPRGLWPRPRPRPRGVWPRPRGFWPRASRPLEAYSRNGTECDWK